MGTFTHSIILISASGEARQEIEAQVDTGATFSSAPAEVLERLGVRREHTVQLRLANGQLDQRWLGFVRTELLGQDNIVPCIFGEPNEPPVIGAVTLEIFLLAVDPVEQSLAPVVGLRL